MSGRKDKNQNLSPFGRQPRERRASHLHGTARLSEGTVRRFTRDIDVSPGIVVGQLQEFGIISYKQLSRLKDRYQWV